EPTGLIDASVGGMAALGAGDLSRQPRIRTRASTSVTRLQASVSPDCSYRLVKEAVDGARREVCFYIYNISAPYLLDLLRSAKERGVQVRVMYDVHDSGRDEQQALADLGVEVRTAPSTGGRSVFTVCHQKYAVIDDATLLIGSANWAKSAIPLVTEPGKFLKANREWIIRIDHGSLARCFKRLFDADWNIPDMGAFAALMEAPPIERALFPAFLAAPPPQVFDIQRFDLAQRAKVTPILSPNNYYRFVRHLILNAQASIDVEQQYILEGGPKTTGLLEALRRRKADGIQIRAIASPAFRKVGKKDNWEKTAEAFDRYGLLDCLRAMNLGFFGHLHNKGIIVDRRQVLVSSTNWSENSIARAREAGVLIDSPEVAGYYAQVFDLDWSLAWPAADTPANLTQLFMGALSTFDGFEEIHPADLA
ncbi:MAG: phosphatidylserine/phosphatidylglycerophosphate/cardiolipin synthase family protein, partial [Anaerolineae bacterium]|nr:phosphatidylserine/phosphatidylglycerophosphate/cardiolipin synthase family protein [Anaerolineae bacterium]